MHILLRSRVVGGLLFHCECGRLIGRLDWPYNEDAVDTLCQGHRMHVLNQLAVPVAWRAGHTSQFNEPIDPFLNAK